jgi:DUF1680 family protein
MKTAVLDAPLRLYDSIGDLARGISQSWLVGMEESNPAILDMFRTRDKKPYRDMLPWSGEFAGKYLTGAHYVWRLTGDEALRDYVSLFIDRLICCIDSDGYIGCYQKDCRMTGAFSTSPNKTGETWDAWSHYHIMLGLILWSEEDGFSERCINAAERIAGFFLSRFYGENQPRLSNIGNTEMNLAPLHGFALLYRITGKAEYLRFALKIAEDTSAQHGGGDYMNIAAAGIEYYQCSKPRWESLHIIIGFAELYRATGDEKYRSTAVRLFYSMLKTDVHNTGAFSTDEMAIGTPYKRGNVELCCVVAFDALAWEVLSLTDDSKIADHLELSLYNAAAGSFAYDGSWCTYNTPSEGEKHACFADITFQCRPGSPRLSCCSANCARAVGSLADWAVTEGGGAVYLNYYGKMQCRTACGVEIEVDGDYPASGDVSVRVCTERRRKIALRIPAWSRHTEVTVNEKKVIAAAGEYLFVEVEGEAAIRLRFELSPRILRGEGDFEGKSCVYCGPVLYGYENSEYSALSLSEVAGYDEAEGYISFRALAEKSAGRGMRLVLRKDALPHRGADGRIFLDVSPDVRLCDFRHLGISGSGYTTWLNLAFSQ